MPNRTLARLTIWTAILGGCVALGASGSRAADGSGPPALAPIEAPGRPATQPAPEAEPNQPRTLAPEPDVFEQMLALERHVRVDMLLYAPAPPSTVRIDALALGVRAR